MKVKDFYTTSGTFSDWEVRSKIERAVMQNYKIHWNDEMTDEVIGHIVNAKKETK